MQCQALLLVVHGPLFEVRFVFEAQDIRGDTVVPVRYSISQAGTSGSRVGK